MGDQSLMLIEAELELTDALGIIPIEDKVGGIEDSERGAGVEGGRSRAPI